uniref:NADH-ubiquinone oxidoreductase chain 2 n=1 Tax=Paradelphomyia sp. ZK-2016 TaxID=1808011 RepID=A0A192U5R0_9DIPT|nr:NADH dehydrogenase subunit 2 [Paradelphomyia sp. ZK-2016]
MFKNSVKLLFFFTLISSTLITVSSNSWMGAWMGLEINLLSFIPLMIDTNNLMSTEGALKYFLTQALASSMLMFSIIMFMFLSNIPQIIYNFSNYSFLMINLTLLLKSGAPPFHFWFPSVMEGLDWSNNLILMTWQKIAPLMLISYCLIMNFMIMITMISIVVGAIGGLNQTSLRKIMAFSSITHLSWMVAAMIFSENLWEMYFLIYTFLSFVMVYLFDTFKLFHINQIFSMFSSNPIIKFSLFFSLLSLGGLPPLLGFFPKWLVIQSMTTMNLLFMVFFMVCLTLVTLYYYIRIYYSSFMLNYWENKWNMNKQIKNFKMKMSLFLSFISSLGLCLTNLIYFI